MGKAYSKSVTLRHTLYQDITDTGWRSTPFPACLSDFRFQKYSNPMSWIKNVSFGPSPWNWRQILAIGNASATSTMSGQNWRFGFKPYAVSWRANPSGPAYGSIRCVTGSAQGTYTGNQHNPPDLGAAAHSEAEYRAAKQFLKNYLKIKNTWRGGNFIAEFRETMEFLRSPVKSIYEHTFNLARNVGSIKRVWRQDPVRYGKLLGGIWLGWSFGLAPLVDDLDNAKSALDNMVYGGKHDTTRIIATGTYRKALEAVFNLGVTRIAHCVQDRFENAEYLVRYLGAVGARPAGVYGWAEDFGVGFDDIVPAVWEGIPWSWLLDYIINIGEVLDSMRLVTADVVWVNRTVRNRAVTLCTPLRRAGAVSSPPNSWNVYIGGGGESFIERKRVTRARSAVPSVPWKWKIPVHPKQWANISALVAAITSSSPYRFNWRDYRWEGSPNITRRS